MYFSNKPLKYFYMFSHKTHRSICFYSHAKNEKAAFNSLIKVLTTHQNYNSKPRRMLIINRLRTLDLYAGNFISGSEQMKQFIKLQKNQWVVTRSISMVDSKTYRTFLSKEIKKDVYPFYILNTL